MGNRGQEVSRVQWDEWYLKTTVKRLERKNFPDTFYSVVFRVQKGNYKVCDFKFQVYDCVRLFIMFTRLSIRRNGLLLEPTGSEFSSDTE